MIQPLHFTKCIGKDFISFYEKVTNCNGVVCFDFEDSISATDQKQRSFLKNRHRRLIINQLSNLSGDNNLRRIGFRINAYGSYFCLDDLAEIDKLDFVNCIFLPKVESKFELEKILGDIPEKVQEIIPIIETRIGFENIKEILSSNNSRFKRIAFGHCDFNLSNRHFPFFHQGSFEYWEWVKYLVAHSKLAGKKLINSPVLHLDDEEFFSQVLSKNNSYGNINGQITLCLNQTLLCMSNQKFPVTSLNLKLENKVDKYELAAKLVESFENCKIEDRFFAIDENRVLISPQEYKLAISIVKKIQV